MTPPLMAPPAAPRQFGPPRFGAPPFPPPPFGPPPYGVPPGPRAGTGRSALVALLAVLAAVAVLLAIGDGLLFAAARGTTTAQYVAGDDAIKQLLDRRAKAVVQHDETAFLADIDRSDRDWLARERTEYDNLVALGLSSFTLTLQPRRRYPVSTAPSSLSARFGGRIRVTGVTIAYAVSAVDDDPVAAPWVPVFGYRDGRWLIAGEASGSGLPDGLGGLPWQTAPISVLHGNDVTVVVSTDDASAGKDLLALAETSVARVKSEHLVDWSGKVLLTAVTDASVFRAYFGDDADSIDDTLAVTVPSFDGVLEWGDRAHYVTSRVVLNPDVLGRPQELRHTLTHEFTHAAFDSVTSSDTPLWLVEGIAEYVAYATDDDPPTSRDVGARLSTVPKALPTDAKFYDNAYNYLLGWQACVYLAKRYGQAKLISFYLYFRTGRGLSTAFSKVLGTTQESFTSGWRSYLLNLRG